MRANETRPPAERAGPVSTTSGGRNPIIPRAEPEGLERAIHNASSDWWFQGALMALKQLALSGRGFTVDNLLELVAGVTLHDDKSADKSGAKGDIWSTKGDISGPGRVTPTPPHQVNHQVFNHHSESNDSAAPSQARAQPNGHESDDLDLDVEGVLEDLDAELGMTGIEMSMAASILQRGGNPNLVRNKITKDRLGQAFGNHDVNQDQKRLEEPTCKNCGVAKSRHALWMTKVGAAAAHPFVAKKRAKA